MNQEAEATESQLAFRRLRVQLDDSYPPGRFIAINGGQIVADAATFEALQDILRQQGIEIRQSLVVQAYHDYPETATNLVTAAPLEG